MLVVLSKHYSTRSVRRVVIAAVFVALTFSTVNQSSSAELVEIHEGFVYEDKLLTPRYSYEKKDIYQIFTNNFSLATGLRVVKAKDDHFYLENERTGKRWYPFVGKNEFGMEFAYSAKLHKFAAGSLAGEVIQFNAITGKYDFVKGGVVDRVIHLSYKDDGSLLAIGSQGDDLYLWHVTDGQKIKIMGDLTSAYMALAATNYDKGGNTLVVASVEGVFGVLKDDGYKEVVFPEVSSGDLLSLTLSPDGEYLTVSLDSGGIVSWSLASLEKQFAITRYGSLAHNMTYLADGKVLAIGLESGEVVFIDATTENGMEVGRLGPFHQEKDSTVMGLHYSEDDSSLYAAVACGPDTFLLTITIPEGNWSIEEYKDALYLLHLEYLIRHNPRLLMQDERVPFSGVGEYVPEKGEVQ